MRLKAYPLYLLICFFQYVFFWMAFTVDSLYFVTTANLDPMQLVLVGTTLEVSIFIFEIPTGVVADLYSRRLSIIIGFFLTGIGFLVMGAWALFFSHPDLSGFMGPGIHFYQRGHPGLDQ